MCIELWKQLQHLQFYQVSPKPVIDAYLNDAAYTEKMQLKFLSFIHSYLENHSW